jgi:hypothetical protein
MAGRTESAKASAVGRSGWVLSQQPPRQALKACGALFGARRGHGCRIEPVPIQPGSQGSRFHEAISSGLELDLRPARITPPTSLTGLRFAPSADLGQRAWRAFWGVARQLPSQLVASGRAVGLGESRG